MKTPSLWGDAIAASPQYPVVGSQKDIRYLGTKARSVLNSPATTGMDFWSINPYVGCAFGCAYCYARFTHRYVVERATAAGETSDSLADASSLPPWLAFERRIFVKQNAAEVLRRRFATSTSAQAVVHGESIVIGTATDPYQPAERLFRVTRSVLEVLATLPGLQIVIITKSPLITRDIDLLQQITSRSRLTVHLSLITLDRDLARRIEPRAPTPESRLRALRRLREADIDTGINIMPVLPGLTDRAEGLAALVRRVAELGATHINCGALRLRASARRRYLPFLAREFPHLASRYSQAYASHHEMDPAYRDGLRRYIKRVCREAGISCGSRTGGEDDAKAAASARPGRERPPAGSGGDRRDTTTRQQQSSRAIGDDRAALWRVSESAGDFWGSVARSEQLELLR